MHSTALLEFEPCPAVQLRAYRRRIVKGKPRRSVSHDRPGKHRVSTTSRISIPPRRLVTTCEMETCYKPVRIRGAPQIPQPWWETCSKNGLQFALGLVWCIEFSGWPGDLSGLHCQPRDSGARECLRKLACIAQLMALSVWWRVCRKGFFHDVDSLWAAVVFWRKKLREGPANPSLCGDDTVQ
ncbi:predicted protein [Plenodomus lingam JN3]|uniref:Predicted protein n=1 Tax=Leptosphaeria maculans (strain JN3 / isolate v23.1.3 / race Av1-4-5-6-7-8) TaxID=985895 RepID=E5A924_LEPMJ|nr:predicted protein [Plenodomus lingam JN3]CBY00119.1 predicted protein [Plenodomus lingam JN3]